MTVHISQLRELSPEQKVRFLSSLTNDEAAVLLHSWEFWARQDQRIPDGDWTSWLILAGRGWGKTRVGSETIVEWAQTGKCKRIALIGETAADVRDVMIEGDSGILTVSPPWFKPLYEPSKRRVTFPNGVLCSAYNAVEPDQLRGPQFDGAWCDELAKWRYAQETWDNLQFGLRLGIKPRQIITTTPRPIKLVRMLLADPTVFATRGRTLDNRDNLAASFLRQVVAKYEGTRLGRQELNAEVLDDVPGALWNMDMLDKGRVADRELPTMQRIIVSIDPAVTTGEDADETGICVVGLGLDSHYYVLEDGSGMYTPIEWARRACKLYKKWSADRIVAETNNGGLMVETTIRVVDPTVPFRSVTATRGKVVRAEPVSALYEKSLCHHVGVMAKLEDQMCSFTTDFDRKENGYSPDRVDALVWAYTELMGNSSGGGDIALPRRV